MEKLRRGGMNEIVVAPCGRNVEIKAMDDAAGIACHHQQRIGESYRFHEVVSNHHDRHFTRRLVIKQQPVQLRLQADVERGGMAIAAGLPPISSCVGTSSVLQCSTACSFFPCNILSR